MCNYITPLYCLCHADGCPLSPRRESNELLKQPSSPPRNDTPTANPEWHKDKTADSPRASTVLADKGLSPSQLEDHNIHGGIGHGPKRSSRLRTKNPSAICLLAGTSLLADPIVDKLPKAAATVNIGDCKVGHEGCTDTLGFALCVYVCGCVFL